MNRSEQTFPTRQLSSPSSRGLQLSRGGCGQLPAFQVCPTQGPPQAREKLCPWHTQAAGCEAEEKHFPKQLGVVFSSLKCFPNPSSHQFPHPHTSKEITPAQRSLGSSSSLIPTQPGQKHQLRGVWEAPPPKRSPQGLPRAWEVSWSPFPPPTSSEHPTPNPDTLPATRVAGWRKGWKKHSSKTIIKKQSVWPQPLV